MPRPESGPDCCSGPRLLTDIKAGTKDEGKQGTGQTLTLKIRENRADCQHMFCLSQWIVKRTLHPKIKIYSLSTHVSGKSC